MRYVGVSNVCGWQLQKAVDLCKYEKYPPIISLQVCEIVPRLYDYRGSGNIYNTLSQTITFTVHTILKIVQTIFNIFKVEF